jgi:hypothetical protein
LKFGTPFKGEYIQFKANGVTAEKNLNPLTEFPDGGM